MSPKIVPLTKDHLEEAALLVSQRYVKLLEAVPPLPSAYAEVDHVLPLLRRVVEAETGCAALEGGKLKGFLTAWLLPSFRGKPCAFSPEWANAAALPHSRRLYEALYGHLARAWVQDGYYTHLISLLTNDCVGIEGWQWLGFGMIAADAVRDLSSVPEGNENGAVSIRQAGAPEIEDVLELGHALGRHVAGSPIFLVEEARRECEYYEGILQNPDYAVWLAYLNGEAVAYMKIGPTNENACTIICDPKTASITGAFTHEKVRGTGIATALLNRSLSWARAKGYLRCAVDFEPMNHWASRFWLRYFQPICYTLVRHVDERAQVASL